VLTPERAVKLVRCQDSLVTIWKLRHVDGVEKSIMNGTISDNVSDVMQGFASQRQVDPGAAT
jgi:hypothetical protein